YDPAGSVPGNGQHTSAFVTSLGGTLSFAILPATDVAQVAGGFGFCDRNQDRKADDVGGGNVFFTAVNGVSVPPSAVLINQTVPASCQVPDTTDSELRHQE